LTNADVRTQASADDPRRLRTARTRSPRRDTPTPTGGKASKARTAGRGERKRLEVTSRIDRSASQLEREIDSAPQPSSGKKQKAAKKQSKQRKADQRGARQQKDAHEKGQARRTHSETLRESQQLVERKRQQREVRRKRSNVRRVLSLLGVLILIAGLAYGVNYALHSSFFAITDIQVTGARLLTQSEVTTQAAIPSGSTVPLLSVRTIEKNLEKNAWVESVRVGRRLPHRVTIALTERKPAAYVDDSAGKKRGWLASTDAVWLGAYNAATATVSAPVAGGEPLVLPPGERAQVVVINDVEGSRFVAGADIESTAVKNALAILNGISAELRAQIQSVSAPNIAGTRLYLKNGVEVDIGSSAQIASKDKIIRELLSKEAGKVTLINVTSVDKATWRGLDSAE